MKKILVLMMVLMMAVSMCACQSEGENTDASASAVGNTNQADADANAIAEPVLSPASAVKLFMQNKDKWIKTPEGENEFIYGFIDLDFDGVLELVASVNAGSGRYSTNSYYKLDLENSTVSELEYASEGQERDQCDFTLSGTPALYKDAQTGVMKYKMADYVQIQTGEYRQITTTLYLDESGKITSDRLWAFHCLDAALSESGNEEFTYFVYDEQGNIFNVNIDDYSRKKAEYESTQLRSGVSFPYIDGYEFAGYDEAKQTETLTGIYSGFSYEGFSFENLETYDLITMVD